MDRRFRFLLSPAERRIVGIPVKHSDFEPVVITGIGMIASVGNHREAVWQAVKEGRSGVRRLSGLRGLPDGELLGAVVDLDVEKPRQLKVFPLTKTAAAEAVADARIHFSQVDPDRFGCSLCSHMGDSKWVDEQLGLIPPPNPPFDMPWQEQWFPCSVANEVARQYRLQGPRLVYSTACASSLISILSATRMIRDNQADVMLAGGADAIDPLFAAGFRQMRVLADDADPQRACRPFDRNRNGFVLGEGGAVFVLERLSHALRRSARIYAQIDSYISLAEAHHVTGMDEESGVLTYLISQALHRAGLHPEDIGYINAHGTGTTMNDTVEIRGIRRAFGEAVENVCVSSTKSMLGHMINAAGGVELAITVLAMRDGFAPPTINLHDPDPELTFDCLPLRGRRNRFQHALKLSVAFGGHLVGIVLSRWNDARSGFAYPAEAVESRVA